jgi:hypothetical protein
MTSAQYVELLRAIREHSGLELGSIREAAEHGADSGWAGFTYTTDGAAFYQANRETVWALLDETADDLGYGNVPALVATFARADMTSTPDGFDCLLAWFALEEVGRFLIDRSESRP